MSASIALAIKSHFNPSGIIRGVRKANNALNKFYKNANKNAELLNENMSNFGRASAKSTDSAQRSVDGLSESTTKVTKNSKKAAAGISSIANTASASFSHINMSLNNMAVLLGGVAAGMQFKGAVDGAVKFESGNNRISSK